MASDVDLETKKIVDDLERKKITIEVIRQMVTQMLTLSASLLAAAVAFAKLSPTPSSSSYLFYGVMASLNFSVIFGLLSYGCMVSHLVNTSLDIAHSPSLKWKVAFQMFFFAVGLILMGFYAASLNFG